MTADDLRTQKALAMLDAEEAKQASGRTWAQFQNTLQSISAAAAVLRDAKYSDPSHVRGKLAPFATVINVDVVVESWQRMFDAQQAEKTANEKLAVFRS